MTNQIYARNISHDERLDSIGIIINPPSGAKKTLRQEFWTDFIGIFTAPDDIIGVALGAICAIWFVLAWGFFLMGKFVFRMNLEKPKAKSKIN